MLINRTMSWDFLVFFCYFHENKRKESWEAVTGWGRVPLILSISNDAQLASCMNFGHQFLTLFMSWFLLYSSWMTFNHFNFDLTSRYSLSCEWEERKWHDPQGNGISKSPRIAECWQFFFLPYEAPVLWTVWKSYYALVRKDFHSHITRASFSNRFKKGIPVTTCNLNLCSCQ